MAEPLARFFATEKDRVNCPFYFKIGACRHGEACTRQHHKPAFSQTLLLIGLYKSPVEDMRDQSGPKDIKINRDNLQKHFEHFFEDVFLEMSMYGEIEDLHCADNLGEHMVGNVYCKFKREESAELAQRSLLGRFFEGRPVVCELSPVTDFREARCRQYEETKCHRGGYCNFMHIKAIPRDLRRRMWDEQTERYGEARKRRREKHKAQEDEDRNREIEKSQSGSRDRSIERREERPDGNKEKEKEERKRSGRSRSRSPKRKRGEEKEEAKPEEPPKISKCSACGGFGKDLVAEEGGKCDHCQRLESGFQYEA